MYWQATLSYHNSVGVVNDDKEYILDKEGKTQEERYHTNNNSKAASIGAIIKANSSTINVLIHLVCYTSKHYNGE